MGTIETGSVLRFQKGVYHFWKVKNGKHWSHYDVYMMYTLWVWIAAHRSHGQKLGVTPKNGPITKRKSVLEMAWQMDSESNQVLVIPNTWRFLSQSSVRLSLCPLPHVWSSYCNFLSCFDQSDMLRDHQNKFWCVKTAVFTDTSIISLLTDTL